MNDPAAPRGPAGAVSPEPGPRTPDPVSADHGPRTPDHASPGHRPPATGPAAPEDPPPFGHTWAALYAIVAGTLAALIVLFALFTRAFE